MLPGKYSEHFERSTVGAMCGIRHIWTGKFVKDFMQIFG